MDDPTTPPGSQDPTATGVPDSEPADRIGSYRMLQKLGEGGMGEVWEAEQQEPVRRRVALKLIKTGMDTRQVVARFESERQALALMDHPSIAKVFDAGATERGRPYFAMEYVKGEPVTEYCDRHRLSTRKRLELFLRICDGIQHAHQKGIIHRDIKPSNVLVTIQDGRPVPKIIDFGVAKATEHRLTETTLFTQMGVLIGTPEYMSPEQAEMTGLDVDTRTDVYSLGVLLYELLVGALPFDSKQLRRAGFDEIRRRIREEEPQRPSTKVGALDPETTVESARRRRTDPVSLKRTLRGDLDWITMKALDKDRTRRYGSPSELALDIRRHLSHEPVLASPPSTIYRMGKFVRRHKVGVAASGLVLLALLLGLAGSTYGFIRATRAEADARREASTAEQVLAFLVGLFEVSDPGEARGESITAREILDRGATQVEEGLHDEPLIRARLMATMGRVYSALGLYGQAGTLLEGALAIRGETISEADFETLSILTDLAIVREKGGQWKEAAKVAARALEGLKRTLGEDHPETLRCKRDLGFYYFRLQRFDEAGVLLLEALDGHRRVLGDDHSETLQSMTLAAPIHARQGDRETAGRLHRESYEGRKRILGEDHPETLTSMSNLAVWTHRQGHYAKAADLNRRALELRSRVLGDDHYNTLMSKDNLAGNLRELGEYVEAERLWRETLEKRRQTLGERHPFTLRTANLLAGVLSASGRPDEAEPLYREVLEGRREVLGEDHKDTISVMNTLAGLFYEQRRYDDAEPLYQEVLDRRRRLLGDDHKDTVWSINRLGWLFWRQERYEEAEPLFREVLERRRRLLGDDHEDTLAAMESLAMSLGMQERYTEAEPLRRKVLEIRRRTLGDEHRDTLKAAFLLGGGLGYQGRFAESETLLQETLETRRRVLGEDHPDVGVSLYGLGWLYARQSRREEALRHLRLAVEAGFTNADHIASDAAFESFHGDSEFESILAAMRERRP